MSAGVCVYIPRLGASWLTREAWGQGQLCSAQKIKCKHPMDEAMIQLLLLAKKSKLLLGKGERQAGT